MTEPLSKAAVLAELADVAHCVRFEASAARELGTSPLDHDDCARRLDAIAAAVASWCVVEGGHRWRRELSERPQDCVTCGQRRAEEGGQ